MGYKNTFAQLSNMSEVRGGMYLPRVGDLPWLIFTCTQVLLGVLAPLLALTARASHQPSSSPLSKEKASGKSFPSTNSRAIHKHTYAYGTCRNYLIIGYIRGTEIKL
jgi:hypothetical protein